MDAKAPPPGLGIGFKADCLRGSLYIVGIAALMQAHYQYLFKSAAEEITELFGYQLILFAVIELSLLARRLAHEPT